MIDYKNVNLDVAHIQGQLATALERPVTEIEIHVWLRRAGFIRSDGGCWFADAEALESLGNRLAPTPRKQDQRGLSGPLDQAVQ